MRRTFFCQKAIYICFAKRRVRSSFAWNFSSKLICGDMPNGSCFGKIHRILVIILGTTAKWFFSLTKKKISNEADVRYHYCTRDESEQNYRSCQKSWAHLGCWEIFTIWTGAAIKKCHLLSRLLIALREEVYDIKRDLASCIKHKHFGDITSCVKNEKDGWLCTGY